MSQGGGGLNSLARHAVAAILGASHPDVSYGLELGAIIALVQDAVASGDYGSAKDTLEDLNEEGCPLGETSASPPDKDDKPKGPK